MLIFVAADYHASGTGFNPSPGHPPPLISPAGAVNVWLRDVDAAGRMPTSESTALVDGKNCPAVETGLPGCFAK